MDKKGSTFVFILIIAIPIVIIFLMIFFNVGTGFVTSGPEYVALDWMKDSINQFCVGSEYGDEQEHGPQFVPYFPSGVKNKVYYYNFETKRDNKYIVLKYSRDKWVPMLEDRETLKRAHLDMCNEIDIMSVENNRNFQFRPTNIIKESMTLKLKNDGIIYIDWQWGEDIV